MSACATERRTVLACTPLRLVPQTQETSQVPIRDHIDETLTWTQPRLLQRSYELRAGEEVVGSLRWEKLFSSRAIAECSGEQWTIERAGFFHPRITARALGSGTDVAVLEKGWCGRGTLEVRGGGTYHWAKTSFWRPSWAFTSGSGELLLSFSTRCVLMGHQADVKVEPRGVSSTDLELLLLLGGYLLVLNSDEAAGAAAIAAASV